MYVDDLYEKSKKKMKNIAKLKKMDLHVHSPASKDYIYSEENIDIVCNLLLLKKEIINLN